MKKEIDLLKGDIITSLSLLALPIMATYLVEMAYNIIDMIWIGRIGSGAVASVGAAGNFVYLVGAIVYMARNGGQSLVGQRLGASRKEEAKEYARTALQMTFILAIICFVFVFLSCPTLISFFKLTNVQVIEDAKMYLYICGGLHIFAYFNQTFTGLFTACAKSSTTFIANSIGMVINIILDPIFIFGYFGLPALGVSGAAIATVISQAIVMIIFLYFSRSMELFSHIKVCKAMDIKKCKQILKIGIPGALQNMLFMVINVFVARIISIFGDAAIAVQKVGWQVESLTYLTAEGFGASMTAFASQNYGARQFKRLKEGYLKGMSIILVWGIFTSCLLVFCGESLFSIFINEKEIIPLGGDYLRILGYTQVMMCFEYVTSGVFNGLGKTLPPSIISIGFNALRIPMATLLVVPYGVNGVWYAITLSCLFKGVTIMILYFVFSKKHLQTV